MVVAPSEGLAEFVGSLVDDDPSLVAVAAELITVAVGLEPVAVASTFWTPGVVQVVATELSPLLYAISVAQICSRRKSAAK